MLEGVFHAGNRGKNDALLGRAVRGGDFLRPSGRNERVLWRGGKRDNNERKEKKTFNSISITDYRGGGVKHIPKHID